MDIGIFPDNLLLLKSRNNNWSTDFQQSGSCPFIRLSDKSRVAKFEAVTFPHKNENKSENLFVESSSSKACSKNNGTFPPNLWMVSKEASSAC